MKRLSLSLPKSKSRSSLPNVKLGVMALIGYCLCGMSIVNAQPTPAEREDAREERLKILRAADQIEIIQTNADKIQVEIATLKEQIAKLQDANSTQEQEISSLKNALNKSEESRAKEREVLLAKVGEMIASAKPAASEPRHIKETPPKDTSPAANTEAPHDAEHGFSHTVEKGQTLSMIAAAFNEKGIKVTVDDIRKANNLGPKDVLKVGQKLFIPKK